jgi:cation:H+ antiporter
MISIAGFTVCAIIIFFSGKKLSVYGDAIAELTGMGRAWIGLILMTSVTTLPELVVGISSAAIVQSADLTLGNVMGSCGFNLCILAMMDMFVPKNKSIFSLASQNHVLAATLSIILIALVGFGLYLPDNIVILPWLGFASILFMIVYVVSIKLLYNFESKNKTDNAESAHTKPDITLSKAIKMYALYGIITIGVALFLPHFAEEIAINTGLGKSFVGTLFLAISTSLPEIAISLSAIRMGAIDLSVGNLLGSNIFNIFILALDDIAYTKGDLLKDASDSNLFSVLATIIMSAIAIIGLTFRVSNKRFLLGWDALLIMIIFILNLVLLYHN